MHSVLLDCTLKQWNNGDIKGLLDEGHAIQQRLDRQYKQRSTEHSARIFAKSMEGKVKAALWLIAEYNNGGILSLDSCVLPDNSETVLISGNVNSVEPVHPVIYDGIDEELIRNTAIKTEGGTGPFGLDAVFGNIFVHHLNHMLY